MNTPTTAVYGELGRYPLYSSRYLRILEYWFRLIQTDNIIMQTVSYEDCIKGKKNWVSNVKKLLYDFGFNYVFDNQIVVNEVVFLSMFKQRILDCFLQEWCTSKSNSSMLTLYHHVKDRFEYETYLDIVPFDLRLRVSSHSLRIQTGRYGNDMLPRNERICVNCNLLILMTIFIFY